MDSGVLTAAHALAEVIFYILCNCIQDRREAGQGGGASAPGPAIFGARSGFKTFFLLQYQIDKLI